MTFFLLAISKKHLFLPSKQEVRLAQKWESLKKAQIFPFFIEISGS